MLEAGGLQYEEESQELYKGRNLGWNYPIDWSRLRQFGGTTGHWTGQSGRLHPSHMAGGPGRPAWPVAHAELLRWYPEAAAFLEVSQDPDSAILARIPSGLRGRELFNHAWQMPTETPVRLAEREEPVIRAHRSIELLAHAAVTSVTGVSPDGTVAGFRFRTLGGREGAARGKRLVLACGGIENARLLEVMRRGGLPIPPASAGHIGRYLQEHPSITPAWLSATDDGLALAAVAARPLQGDGGLAMPAISTPPELQARAGSGVGYFRFSPLASGSRLVPGRPLWPSGTIDRVRFLFGQYDELTFERLASRFPGLFRPDRLRLPIELFVEMEQMPDPRNRVGLGRARDAIGLPIVEVDMQVRERDVLTMKTLVDHFARSAIAHDLGRVALLGWAEDPLSLPDKWGWSWHHNGTTRMSRRAEDGVVDADHLLWGTRNLHVAGASVFPSSSFVNPTLTIVALSMRLGERLKDLLKG
jgi:choline dehydrogenase-like flavoprotein